ncbi:MAG: hypothetical protein N2509_02120 [Treponemataceae bacterium]|nr:hypothetical protein [Treponemataceae bacterium]
MTIRIRGWQEGKLLWILRGLLVLLVYLGGGPGLGAQNLDLPAAGKSSPTGILLAVSLEVQEGVQRAGAVLPSFWEESLAASLASLPQVGAVFQGQLLRGSEETYGPPGEVGPASKAQGQGDAGSAGGSLTPSPAGQEGPAAGGGPGETVPEALSTEAKGPSLPAQVPPTEKENVLLRWAAPRNYDYLVSGSISLASPSSPRGGEGAGTPSSKEGARVFVRLSLRDVISLKIIHTLEWNAPFPSEAELLQTFWLPLLDAVSSLSSTDYVTSLTIQGLPGTRVRGFTEKPVIIPEEGTAVVQVPKLHSFSWHATTPGHEDLSGSWLTMNEEETLALSPLPLLRNTLELGMLRGQFGDFWLGRYFFQNRLHLKIGAEQYIVGFYFPSTWESSDVSMTISLPMILPGLVGEWFFGENQLFIRPYVALGALLRLNLDQAALDPVAPLIVLGRGGLLWRVNRQWSFFGELGVDWYPFADGPLLVASQKTQSEGSSPLFLYSDRWYLDFFVFRCGVRISYE